MKSICYFLYTALILAPAEGDPPRFPRTPPTEPTAATATFRTRHGFRMELIAAEPLVYDPVAAAYDEDGRLYVVEMSDYPHVDPKHDKPFAENTLDPPVGRLKLLTDRDDDGIFDTAAVLADKLSWPTGVAVWKGGVFVAATPSLWYIKDADGDGRAEIREEVFTGFRKFNIQAVMNNLQWGLDHMIYGAGSSNGGEVRRAGEPRGRGVSILRRDFRFRPDTRAFEAISGGARFGNTFDDWGNRFLCDIRNPVEHVVLPARYLARNPYLAAPRALHDAALAGDAIRMYRISPPEPWREFRARRWAANGRVMPRSELVGAGYLTSSSGVTIYRGDAYPPDYRGQVFLGEVANNLIHREDFEPDGVTFRARRADEKAEFVASTDTWFRPVNFVNAPDGTLHVLDMYREVIEHPWSIPDDIKAGLDFRSGEDRGRIYRLAHPGFRRRPTPKLSRATTDQLIALLEHRNAWHRDTALRLIFERQDRSAIGPLRAMLRDWRTDPLGRLGALWSLDGLNALEDDDIDVALGDPTADVCEHAVLLAEPRLGRSGKLSHHIINLAHGPSIRVRFQVAFALGEIAESAPRAVKSLAEIARRDAEDPWVRTAVLSAPAGVAGPIFRTIVTEGRGLSNEGSLALLHGLAGIVGASGDTRAAARLLDDLAESPVARERYYRLDEAVVGLAEGLSRAGGKSVRDVLTSTRSPHAREMLDAALRRAEVTAGDRGADLDRRERAAALIGQGGFATAGRVLAPLLTAGEPQRLQLAAVRALATISEPGVATLLLHRWPALSPSVRSEVIARLLSRAAWTTALLDAIEAGTVPAALIPPNRRALLMNDRDTAIRERAGALLGGSVPGSRRDAYEQYRAAALDLPAEPSRGERVFERECITCHKLGERGYAVGPNLASVQRRTPEELLLHIIDPNREVAPDYLEYAVSLEDGRILTGLIVAESAGSLTLRRPGGAEDTVLRTNIEAVAATGKSLMPEGLEARVSSQEMADLIAFLRGVQE
jgi:putative membrane-bound dehydrogenase-like protein